MNRKQLFREAGRVILRSVPFGLTANDLLELVSKINASQRDLDKQVKEAMESLTTSTELISNLERSLEERAEKLNKLKAEYERVSKLAEITKGQGDAVAKTLEQVLGKGQNRERWFAFAINLAAGLIIFVLGVFLSDWIRSLPGRINF